jgi:hypothetical protein
MRKVFHLEAINYLSRLRMVKSHVMTLSGQYNINLFTLDRVDRGPLRLELFAKFNSSTMNGFDVIAGLRRNNASAASLVEYLRVYRISDSGWGETLLGTAPMVEIAPSVFSAFVSLSFLGANELSGAETYALEVSLVRQNAYYRQKSYFNHLGCFDSINELRKRVNYVETVKLDE